MLMQGLGGSKKTIAPNTYEQIFGREGAELARKLAPRGIASVDDIEGAAAQAGPERAAEYQALLDTARARLGASGKSAPAPAQLRAHQARADIAEQKAKAEFNAAMNRYVIGQNDAKEVLWQIIQAREANILAETPTVLAFPGPPGVGKTEMTRALAAYFHGDPEKVAKVEGGGIKDKASLNTHFGAPPQFVGHKNPDATLELGNTKLQHMYGDKRPIIVLLDEIDKIGGNDPEVWKTFEDMLTGALDHGQLKLLNGEEVDLRDCLFIMTSNAGADDATGLEGDALKKHYVKALEANLKGHIYSRMDNVVPFEPLSQSDRVKIVSLHLGKLLRAAESRLCEKTGAQVSLSVSEPALEYLAELSASRSGGARELKKIVKNLLQPLVSKGLLGAQDEEKYELRFSTQSTEKDRKQLIKEFNDNGGKIPPGVASRLGLELVCTSKRPTFGPYEGSLPFTEPMHVWGSAVVGGKSFVCAYDGNETKLQVLAPGQTDADNCLLDIAGLPDAIRNANLEVQIAKLDEHRLILRSITCPEEGKAAEQCCAIYDTQTEKCESTAAPPVALYGAAMASVEGHTFLTGGRVPQRDRDGNWQIVTDPTLSPGRPSESAILHRLPDGKWELLRGQTLSEGRSQMAAASIGNEIHLCGGETIFKTASGVYGTRSSKAVDVIRVEEGKVSVERGADLLHPTAYASAIADEASKIVTVMGGVDFHENGTRSANLSTVQRLRAHQETPEWKSSEQDAMPEPSYKPAIIAIPGGHVVGPLVGADTPYHAWR